MALRRIGQILIDLGFLTEERVRTVLDEQRQRPTELFGQVAIGMGLISDEQLVQGLAEQMGLQVISLADLVVPPHVLAKITEPMAQLYRVVPVNLQDDVLTIAMCDPQKLSVVDELRTFLGCEVRAVVATEKDVLKALSRYYAAGGESVETLIADMEQDTDLAAAAAALEKGVLDLSGAEALADSAPVRKLLNMVLLMAIKDHASDLHFEPFENEFKIRIRADGVLYEMVPPPRHLAFAITTRIKVMADLDIAERRLPQDGRIRLSVGGHPVDLRVSVLPTMFGESVVMRVLDRSVVMLDLGVVGMDPGILTTFREIIRRPNGIVLVTGPTGSGKTTTLYSALSTINDPAKNVMTLEDPVEYNLPGVVQCQVNPDGGMDFATGLRANMRQDPNIVMIGEIRDGETANTAIKAALTGHLVLSTLHTNNAPATVMRLVDMGVDRMYVGSSLLIVVAQRLVRRICKDCKEPYEPDDDELLKLRIKREDMKGHNCHKGRGCAKCGGGGYKGRVALYEIMRITPVVEEAIYAGMDLNDLTEVCINQGMSTLRMLAVKKWKMGVTSADEILAVTAAD